ncbi:hypothetical protein SAMN05192574_108201 [Mucilaginibacter gossypiicola]|uniref:Uncharacterized protein n=1 Tax=Mucilaginibacter gossypiicola TaxID=551995 RepID=A0A1H8PYH8_9SPHI|nr:hypothetical protein [Mucilaginibacter gossypiicola]SEO47072.1 hypothetical protein SAMN05192574_108201 [Mucilaginibacter gossypiicola]
MAIGYSSVIFKSYKSSFDDFLDAVSTEFILFGVNATVLTVDDDGENVALERNDVINIYSERRNVTVIFRNADENAIACTIKDVGGFIEESYSMDQLFSSEEEEQLFQFTQKRYESLRAAKVGIGFIFDVEGYSEDYIKIAYNAWGN